MGAAVSAQSDIAEMLAYTLVISRALAGAFPDIYTPLDFHANPGSLAREMEMEQREQLKQTGGHNFQMVTFDENGAIVPYEGDDEDFDQDFPDEWDESDAVPLEDCIIIEYDGRSVPIAKKTIGNVNCDGWNVLHACCHQPFATDAAQMVVDEMLEQGLSLDIKTSRGPGTFASEWTPLHIAAAYGLTQTVRLLLAAGASADTTNSACWTPLYEAVHRGYNEIAEMLLKNGACAEDLIPANFLAPYHPQYPLAHACRQGHVEIVKLLLAHGVDVNAQSEAGWCALHESVYFRNEACVKILLQHGCDTSLRTAQGYTVFDFEVTPQIAKLLAKYQPERSITDGTTDETCTTSQGGIKVEYRLLGDLPTFGQAPPDYGTTARSNTPPQSARDGGAGGMMTSRRTLRRIAEAEKGVPPEYACQLSGKLMNDPVTTVHGNHFEKSIIQALMSQKGNTCPITGLPLSACEIKTDTELRIEINNWKLKEALQQSGEQDDVGDSVTKKVYDDDEIYDF